MLHSTDLAAKQWETHWQTCKGKTKGLANFYFKLCNADFKPTCMLLSRKPPPWIFSQLCFQVSLVELHMTNVVLATMTRWYEKYQHWNDELIVCTMNSSCNAQEYLPRVDITSTLNGLSDKNLLSSEQMTRSHINESPVLNWSGQTHTHTQRHFPVFT